MDPPFGDCHAANVRREARRTAAEAARSPQIQPHRSGLAISSASNQGVRGARIHDLMHAVAAEKYQAEVLFSLDEAGFSTLKTPFR
jgi:hypothetical protein